MQHIFVLEHFSLHFIIWCILTYCNRIAFRISPTDCTLTEHIGTDLQSKSLHRSKQTCRPGQLTLRQPSLVHPSATFCLLTNFTSESDDESAFTGNDLPLNLMSVMQPSERKRKIILTRSLRYSIVLATCNSIDQPESRKKAKFLRKLKFWTYTPIMLHSSPPKI